MSSSGGGLFQAKFWLLHVPSPHGNPCWGSTACLEDSDPKIPSTSGALLAHVLPDALLIGTPADCPSRTITMVHEGKVGSEPSS